MESGNIGKDPIYQSVHLSVHPRTFLHDVWMSFLHIEYYDQISCATDTCKIESGSVPTLSYYGHFFHTYFEYLLSYLREECGNFVIFGTVIKYHALLMHVK